MYDNKEVETIELLTTIAPENLTPEVIKVLKYLGPVVVVTTERYGDDEDDCTIDYEFPFQTEGLLICGDDAWGGVTRAYVHEGHLILVANYGDDGEFAYNLTGDLNRRFNKISLSDITICKLLSEI